MSYIGKSPSIGSYSMLDNLTASATASYSLTLDSVAFVPESANHLIVSLNGVIQKAGSSFTVSSSTLTFSSALTSSDSIDFILALGNVLDIGTPSDATVTNAKTNFVSTSSAAGLQIKGDGTTDGTLQLNCSQNSHGVKIASPAHSAGQSYTLTLPTGNVTADKFLKVASITGSGTTAVGQLSFANAGGITVADQLRITANITSNTNPISANIERVDGTAQGGLTDNQMSVSSGIFTFPLTGIYFVAFGAACVPTSGGDNIAIEINATTNNSSYSQIAYSAVGGDNRNQQAYCQSLVDVTDTSNVKVKFSCSSIDSGSVIYGGTDINYTYFTFVRLGDT